MIILNRDNLLTSLAKLLSFQSKYLIKGPNFISVGSLPSLFEDITAVISGGGKPDDNNCRFKEYLEKKGRSMF